MQRKFKFTKTSIESKALPPGADETNSKGNPVKDRIYWDTELPGFGVRVGRPRIDPDSGRELPPVRTFIAQKDIDGRTRRVTVGRYGVYTVEAARKRAMALLVQMNEGIDPTAARRAEKVASMTLAEAIDLHVQSMRNRGCAERSIQCVPRECGYHLGDWISRPLASITRAECIERHARITERGKYAANRTMRLFRAVWNTAARANESLPRCPVVAVTFNKERRRREPVSWADLPDWWAKVESIANPVRRDLQWFILFTGLRSTDAKTVRWEHVDFEAETIHRPMPKGGVDRAFTVPVSSFVLDLLRRRRDQNPLVYGNDRGWVFPSTDMQGRVCHVSRVGEQRYTADGRKVNFLPSPHRLRDTFATACYEAGLHPMDIKVLMNHVLPGANNVTEGYIRPSIGHLSGQIERVAEFLLGKIRETNSGEDAYRRAEAG